ncbi:TetR/AcrR family transcriptional regulator [Halioglobus maricola]|uniref:TetR/AcrR family transcriptional regulator n=1 Tax=Halioglobus maricola TaxID=2601894 RepID=A0A5P9NL60_9GAMM|nr:TetR/AcrR family transcriptional regulator [Halioglobus maricola]QFU76570.1 TetR/AcrR family transcriptional regulator [Halioglobus maricola]
MTTPKRQVELLEKNRPRQERAKRTYEAIINAAAELLVEVGVERISTNLIAERAGITVPALYRYFPNKYAVLHALGAVLMDRQNEAFEQWMESFSGGTDEQDVLADIYSVLKLTYDVTRDMPGGLEVSLALRAVEPLRELRITSNRMVSEQFAAYMANATGIALDEQLQLQCRLGVEMAYAVVENALEDSALPEEQLLREGARMLHAYLDRVIST